MPKITSKALINLLHNVICQTKHKSADPQSAEILFITKKLFEDHPEILDIWHREHSKEGMVKELVYEKDNSTNKFYFADKKMQDFFYLSQNLATFAKPLVKTEKTEYLLNDSGWMQGLRSVKSYFSTNETAAYPEVTSYTNYCLSAVRKFPSAYAKLIDNQFVNKYYLANFNGSEIRRDPEFFKYIDLDTNNNLSIGSHSQNKSFVYTASTLDNATVRWPTEPGHKTDYVVEAHGKVNKIDVKLGRCLTSKETKGNADYLYKYVDKSTGLSIPQTLNMARVISENIHTKPADENTNVNLEVVYDMSCGSEQISEILELVTILNESTLPTLADKFPHYGIPKSVSVKFVGPVDKLTPDGAKINHFFNTISQKNVVGRNTDAELVALKKLIKPK